jgi:WD40 repeat protein
MPDGFPLFPLQHQQEIVAIRFSPDSQYIATASEDQTVKIWETATGHLISTLTHQASVHTIAFSPDGMYLATGCGNGVVSAWLWRTEDLIHETLWKGKDAQ